MHLALYLEREGAGRQGPGQGIIGLLRRPQDRLALARSSQLGWTPLPRALPLDRCPFEGPPTAMLAVSPHPCTTQAIPWCSATLQGCGPGGDWQHAQHHCRCQTGRDRLLHNEPENTGYGISRFRVTMDSDSMCPTREVNRHMYKQKNSRRCEKKKASDITCNLISFLTLQHFCCRYKIH